SHTITAPDSQLGPSGGTRYVFTDWSDSGDRSHSVTVSATPTTYMANFRTDYRLAVQLNGSGTVERIPASADGYYESGTTVQLIPHPADGFQFVNWTGDLTGTGQSQTLAMNSDRVVMAVF